MPGEHPIHIVGKVVEVSISYKLAYVKVDNGNVYHIHPTTPGINFSDLACDQLIRLEVLASTLNRVFSAKILKDVNEGID